MERPMQVQFLRALSQRLRAAGAVRVQPILHARVPIIKFVDGRSGLDCDIAIGSCSAVFKSAVLGLLARYEWRLGALVRLVKLWARRRGINDASAGTLNSFALTLMVVFHLQTRTPRVLPPISELFLPAGASAADAAARPMQAGAPPDMASLQEAGRRLTAMAAAGGDGNRETLLELLSGFFALYRGVLGGWAPPGGGGGGGGGGGAEPGGGEAAARLLRRVRVDTWAGALRHEPWEREGVYLASVEDPFDSTDNCARTVREPARARAIGESFAQAAAAMEGLGRGAGGAGERCAVGCAPGAAGCRCRRPSSPPRLPCPCCPLAFAAPSPTPSAWPCRPQRRRWRSFWGRRPGRSARAATSWRPSRRRCTARWPRRSCGSRPRSTRCSRRWSRPPWRCRTPCPAASRGAARARRRRPLRHS
jgi:hypothetical protein